MPKSWTTRKNVAGRQKKKKNVFCRFCRFCRPTREKCRRATKMIFCSRGFFFFQSTNYGFVPRKKKFTFARGRRRQKNPCRATKATKTIFFWSPGDIFSCSPALSICTYLYNSKFAYIIISILPYINIVP